MAEQSRAKKFVTDVGIYTLSSFGSRIMTFLMVPVYTFFVNQPSDFGYYDMCMVICSLLHPIASLRLTDGAIRFLVDTNENNHYKRKQVVSSLYGILIQSLSVWLAIAIVLRMILGAVPYMWHSLAFLLSNALLAVSVQIARGLGRNKFFAAIGLITTFLIVVFTIICLAILKMGIEGIFISNILARVCALIITEWRIGAFRRFFSLKVDVKTISHDILKFSVPLIPTALCWWLISANGRFFINHYMGLEFNGIYAVAMRFASIFDSVSYIFGTAWQETAIRQYGKPDSEQFFSKILSAYIVLLSAILVIGAFVFKLLYPIIVAKSYHDSVNYIFLLGLSAAIFAIASFLELGYQCAKETHRTVLPILAMGVINVLMNMILVRFWGVYGICIASCVSYAFLMIYRWFDTKRYFKLRVLPTAIGPILLAGVSLIPYYVIHNFWGDWIYMLVASVLLIYWMPIEAKQMIKSKLPNRTFLHI